MGDIFMIWVININKRGKLRFEIEFLMFDKWLIYEKLNKYWVLDKGLIYFCW